MEGGIGILLILVAAVVIGVIAAWLLGWGGFAGFRHREQAGEQVSERERPEHTRPTNPAQEHTHFVGSDRD
jgi:hypothetical protein